MLTETGRAQGAAIQEKLRRAYKAAPTGFYDGGLNDWSNYIMTLTVGGKWPEGIVTRWKENTCLSGIPTRSESTEDADLDMLKNCFEAYLKARGLG